MRGGTRGRIRLAAWLVAAELLAAGCSSAPPSFPAPIKLTNAELAVLTNFGLTGLAAAQVNNAYETLVQRCMESKGLVYYALIQSAAAETNPHPQLVGVPQASIGLAERETGGYGFYSLALQAGTGPAGPDQPGGTDPEGRYIASLPTPIQQKYLMALEGRDGQRVTVAFPGGSTASITTGGCRGSVERQMYGSVANYLQATTGASLEADQFLHAVAADPAFAAVITRWSSCMARHRYRYSSPEDLWNRLGARIDKSPTPAARDLEIRVSVVDYNCSAAVRLVATVRALQNEHARYLAKALAQNLAVITQIDARALTAAKALHLPS